MNLKISLSNPNINPGILIEVALKYRLGINQHLYYIKASIYEHVVSLYLGLLCPLVNIL